MNSLQKRDKQENIPRNKSNSNTVYELEETNIKSSVFLGCLIMFLILGGSIYWSITAKLNGAVVAPASFVVEGNRKTVQHLEGGIVSDLLVKEGDFVKASQVLMRLDGTENGVDINVLGSQLAELHIRRARLIAEINSKEKFEIKTLDSNILSEITSETQQNLFLVQQNLFEAQLRTKLGEKEILEQRILSLRREISGLEEQKASTIRQSEIAETELVAFSKLSAKGLAPLSRVNSVKREIERLLSAKASFETSLARALNQIGELKLDALAKQKLRNEAITSELATIETRIASLEPQYFGAKQKQKRIIITAPVSGRIVNMNIYTSGAVIRPGEAILDIVPTDDKLIVEAKINTVDIEKLRVGQTTRIRLSAFDQTEAPEATGQIINLSADSITDERTGQKHYVARISLDEKQITTVEKLNLIPGMPADVFVNTGERTAFSYLMQPLNDRFVKTFVE